MFGLFYQFVCVSEAKKLGVIVTIVDKIFPMAGKKWVFNLTHILLLGILISICSMMHHPAQDALEENATLIRRKKEKDELTTASKKDKEDKKKE